jgi:hypothetical protein
MKEVKLDRTHFHESLAAEYFDKKKLEAQTGQPFDKFSDVILKELLDNALDACESMGIDPVIHIGFSTTEDRMRLCVRDNGNGISEELLKNILNFEKRTSDKVAYESPSRGAQGNALKTIIGIPYALGGGKIIIESHGLHNEIIATANPAGLIDINLKTTEILDRAGTTIYVDFPVCTTDFFWWGQAFAIFNPHALVKITQFDDFEFALNLDDENLESGVFVKNDEIERKVTMVTSDYENSENVVFYQKIADCSKIKPNAPTSSYWYNSHALVKLVFLQGDQHDITIRDFVRQFDGLSSTSKAKQITSQITGKMLSDIYRDPVEIEKLRLAMQALSKPMLPKTLGAIVKKTCRRDLMSRGVTGTNKCLA